MEIVVSNEQGRVPVTVFRIKGKVIEGEQLKTQAEQALEAGTRNLLLDLQEVPFITSSGLRVLHHIYLRLRTDAPDKRDETVRAGIRDGTYKSPHLKLLNPSKNVQEALKYAGFDMFLEIYHNLKDAVASF